MDLWAHILKLVFVFDLFGHHILPIVVFVFDVLGVHVMHIAFCHFLSAISCILLFVFNFVDGLQPLRGISFSLSSNFTWNALKSMSGDPLGPEI